MNKVVWGYCIRKVALLLLSLFVVATATFVLMHAVPGDPFIQEESIPEEILKNMYAHYGLDKPWHIQYFKYLKGLITWDLGPSFKYEGRTVNDIIAEGFPISFLLGLEALVLAIVCGVTLGAIAAVKRSKWEDRTAMLFAVIGISVPGFIKAAMLQYLFAMQLNLLPVARWGTFQHSILPAIALAAFPTAFIARLTRANMVEVLEQDFVQTARSKGLSTSAVVLRHVLKNSSLPVLTYLGPLISTVLTGTFIIEKLFGIPGLGGWFINSISNRDYTVIMGLTLFYATFLMLCVAIVDVLYAIIDPRISLENKAMAKR